jgi:hypothetical protein
MKIKKLSFHVVDNREESSTGIPRNRITEENSYAHITGRLAEEFSLFSQTKQLQQLG